MPIKEFYLDKVLQALDFTMNEVRLSCSPEHHIVDSAGSNLYSSFLVFIWVAIIDLTLVLLRFDYFQFIDLCILLGCDYCDSIRGVGPKRALELMKQHKSLEKILEKIDQKKYTIPENWPYQQARALFKEPEVEPADAVEMTWSAPDEEGLVAYMCAEKGSLFKRYFSKVVPSDRFGSNTSIPTLLNLFRIFQVSQKIVFAMGVRNYQRPDKPQLREGSTRFSR